MGASQGKSKKQQKEEAQQRAETKDIELATLYGENTKRANEMRLLEVDFQAMKQMIEQQKLVIEYLARENGRMLKRFEEKEPEQEKQGACCCPTTEEAHEAELQRMFDEEWELVLSSHALVSAQLVATRGHLNSWEQLDEKGLQAATYLKQYGYPHSSIEEMRRLHDDAVKHHKDLFKFKGNAFRSIFRSIYMCPDELKFERGLKLERGLFHFH